MGRRLTTDPTKTENSQTYAPPGSSSIPWERAKKVAASAICWDQIDTPNKSYIGGVLIIRSIMLNHPDI